MEDKEKIEERETMKNKVIKLFQKVPYKIFIVLFILLIIVIIIPKRLPSIFSDSTYSKIEKICELSTVEAYYHEVAEKTEDASALGKIIGNIGYKKYWLEYDAIIKYGIDAKKVKISKPNIKNEVRVYIPKAEILGEPQIVKEYMQDPITDSGFLTSIKEEYKTEAIEMSIKDLKEKASQDKDNLELAYQRAKVFFEKYLINAGREFGVEYKIIFE